MRPPNPPPTRSEIPTGVTDCAIGISAENADRLSNAFFTTKSSEGRTS
jgi:hypothetical protein